MVDKAKALWESYRVYIIVGVVVVAFVYVGFMVGK